MNNREYLRAVVSALGPLANDLVFTGGLVVQEYLTIPAVGAARVTRDADAICQAGTYSEYRQFGERLRELGFTQSASTNTPPYRWRIRDLVLDVMPLDETVLRFTNRWYASGVQHAIAIQPEDDLALRILDAPHFLASKLEAYMGRGHGDPYSSHDLEDVVTVLAGRPELVDELDAAPTSVGLWVGEALAEIFPPDRRVEYISAHLESTAPPGLAIAVGQRIDGLIDLSDAT